MKKRSTSSTHSNSGRTSRRSAPSAPARSRSRSRAVHLNQEWFRTFLSEMLAVERGGVQLYEKALEQLTHDDLRPKLEQFHQQTERHVELCEEMLNTAGAEEGSA